MRTIKILALLLILISAKSTLAQEATDFKLSDYKYRTSGFHSMAGGFASNGNFSNSNMKADTGKTRNGNHQFSLNGSLSWEQLYSTDARQHIRNYSTATMIENSGSNTVGMKTANDRYYLGGSVSEQNIFYRDQYFLEAGGSLGISADLTNTKSQDFKTNTSMITPSIGINAGIGKGRVENVMDAQMALFLLNELQKRNMIRGKVSRETAYRFAELITCLHNRRIFDYRVRRTTELTAIDSFIKANKLVSSYDINYFTTINDVWSFSIQSPTMGLSPLIGAGTVNSITGNFGEIPPGGYIKQLIRYSGTIRFLRLSAYTNWNIQSSKTDSIKTSTNGNYKTAHLGLGIEKYIPINLNWQRNFRVEVGVLYLPLAAIPGMPTIPTAPGVPLPNDSTENPGLAPSSKFSPAIDASYSLGYFPNTRTAVHMGVSANANKPISFGKMGTTGGLSFGLSADLVASYFINYNTRISGEFYLTPLSAVNGFKANSPSVRFNVSYYHYFY